MPKIDLESLDLKDKRVFAEFAKGNNTGTFQFDTKGLIRLSQQIKIENFDEIMAATALHRPGPLHGGQAARYPNKKLSFKVKKGSSKTNSKGLNHPVIRDITKDTYGEILYQEQIMMIVRKLGNFNWKDTNDIRKCMSKSGGAEYFYRNYWEKFKDGCAKHNIDEKEANRIFKSIMTFGCLSGDTIIKLPCSNQYSPKKITIKELYENGGIAKIATDTSNRSVQKNRKAKIFCLQKDKIVPTRLIKIFQSGKKQTWLVKLSNGSQIRATKDHHFLTMKGWETLRDISIGSKIMVMGDKFPSNKFKTANGESVKFKKRKTILKKKFKWCCICKNNPNEETHHEDGNRNNNTWMNLTPCCRKCHKQKHLELDGKLPVPFKKGRKPEWAEVVKVSKPKMEMTYDISMPEEWHNYVANDIVVHNSWSFNKSHACSYGIVSYYTMWLKLYYPKEYAVAYLNKVKRDMKNDPIPRMISEIKRLGINIEEPDVSRSGKEFVISGDSIFCSLTNIKGVGPKAIDNIIENQPYDSLIDFYKKTTKRIVNKGVVLALIKAGCFRKILKNTKTLVNKYEEIHNLRIKEKYDKLSKWIKIISIKGKEYDQNEEVLIKSSVSSISIGRHIVTVYDDFIKNFGKHIKISKLNELKLNTSAEFRSQAFQFQEKVSVYCLGLLRSIDLKRISQEVKYVVASEDEFRYAICDFVDDTDYAMLSFQAREYKIYEKKLWEAKGKVVLIKGSVTWGVKKIYVNNMWIMDDLVKDYKVKNLRDVETKFLFKHPLYRFPVNKIKLVRQKHNCYRLSHMMKLNEGDAVRVFGIIKPNQEIRVIKNGKHKGKEIHIFELHDGLYGYTLTVFPWQPNFKKIIVSMESHSKSSTPVIIDSEFKQIVGSQHKKHLKRASLYLPYGSDHRQIFEPFAIKKK